MRIGGTHKDFVVKEVGTDDFDAAFSRMPAITPTSLTLTAAGTSQIELVGNVQEYGIWAKSAGSTTLAVEGNAH